VSKPQSATQCRQLPVHRSRSDGFPPFLHVVEFFRETLGHLKRLFRVSPEAAAHDLHPNYLSTRYALEESGLRPIGVQHHHAHIASCMADNGIDGRVIGVALDGTGYGTDGQIWGGEFLVCDYGDFERRGHFGYIPLAGGDRAVREPWRSALAYLDAAFGSEAAALPLPVFREIPPKQIAFIHAMIARHIQTVETSSCGRLFDAVASILGIRHETTYEGQAAVELEAVANRIRESERLNRVCLSGGTFQNLRLLEQSLAGLRARGFETFIHHRVPPNDGGLSLGQAVVANYRLAAN
jgi:hydrogenase maturation factor HypF (carbamoyltransferase family)